MSRHKTCEQLVTPASFLDAASPFDNTREFFSPMPSVSMPSASTPSASAPSASAPSLYEPRPRSWPSTTGARVLVPSVHSGLSSRVITMPLSMTKVWTWCLPPRKRWLFEQRQMARTSTPTSTPMGARVVKSGTYVDARGLQWDWTVDPRYENGGGDGIASANNDGNGTVVVFGSGNGGGTGRKRTRRGCRGKRKKGRYSGVQQKSEGPGFAFR